MNTCLYHHDSTKVDSFHFLGPFLCCRYPVMPNSVPGYATQLSVSLSLVDQGAACCTNELLFSLTDTNMFHSVH